MQQKIEWLQAQLGDLKEFQVLNYARENAHLKATYKNLFDSISVSRAQTKTIIASLQNELQSNIYKNAKLRTQLFKKVSDQKDNTQDTSANIKFAKKPIVENLPKVGKTNALSNPDTSNSVSTPQESKGVNNDKVIAPGMFRINPSKTSREEKHVPNTVRASVRTKPITVSQLHVITKKDVNSDLNGNLAASSNSKSQYDCSNGDNACTSNATEPKIKRFPNSTSLLDRLFRFVYGNLKLLINFIWKFMGTVRFGNDYVAAILGFSDLQWGNIMITKVAFRRNACFIRNMEVADLFKGDRSTNLYTINRHEMASASPIYLMARASSTKSWLWHQRLSHLNFDTINDLVRNDLVVEIHLLHMDLCGPMRIASINGTRYVLVIVDDYSRYTWVHFPRSKDEAPENGVVERRNRTLVEVARTMLIFSRAPLFLWAEAIATACFTQNRSIIHRRFNKTPYELINDRKPDISFLYVFDALCSPKNNREDIGKLGAKGDIGFFIGYSADSCAYRVYNHQTKKIMETMNVSFDELSAMAFKQHSSKPGLQSMTSRHISLGLDLTYAPSTITTQQASEGELDLLFEAMYDDYIGGQPSATARTVSPAQEPQVCQTLMASTTIANTSPIPTNSSSLATNFPISLQDVDELNPNVMVDGNTFVNPFANSSTKQVIREPLQPVLIRNQLRSDGDMCMYALTVSTMEPKNVKEAMTDPAWIDSMQEELLQFKRLDVWVLVPALDNISPLTLKWLFKNKHDEEQTVIRNKSRLVVRGYRQEEGINFHINRLLCFKWT
nr:hypothetical protein [Tanacetum cinerariifolium]